MGVVATAFEALPPPGVAAVDACARAVVHALRTCASVPSLALVFCSGLKEQDVDALASRTLRELGPQAPPIVVACGLGLIAQGSEHEGALGLTGLVLANTELQVQCCEHSQLSADDLEQLWTFGGRRPRPVLTFLRAEAVALEQVWQARPAVNNPHIFGAGTHGQPGILLLEAGRVRKLQGIAVQLGGPSALTRTAHSFELLSPLKRVTRAEGSMVLELEGAPALTVLEQLGSQVEGRPLLLTILAHRPPDDGGPGDMLVRGIQGIDPSRRGLLISSEVEEGCFMTFGVRNAGAARSTFEGLCRDLQRQLAGAEPRFGLYFNCSGRGVGLHQTPHVDARVLRERFPRTPFCGFQSAFEIAPYCEAPALQLYTGVLTLFSLPS